MKICLLVCLLCLPAISTWAEPFSPELPKAAKNIEEITRAFEMQRGNGFVEYALFKGFSNEVFVTWNCPFSGLAATFVFAYAFDGSSWTLFYNKCLDGTHTISVQSPSDATTEDEQLIIRSAEGKTMETLSLKSLPKIHSHVHDRQP